MKKIYMVLVLLMAINTSFADSAFNVNLRYGSKGADVKEMQEFLIDQGFLTGTASGSFYAMTLKAVKAFQAKNNLPASGFWGAMTRQVASKLIDLSASDEEATTTPIVSQQVTPQVQTQAVQPIVQYIYVPTTPTVSTHDQEVNRIESEYAPRLADIRSKDSDIRVMFEIDNIWSINNAYNSSPLHPLPSFASSDYQKQVIQDIYSKEIVKNYGFQGIQEYLTKLSDSINNQFHQVENEKLSKEAQIK